MGMLPWVARILHDEQADAEGGAAQRAGARASGIQAQARFVRLLTQVGVMACAATLVILHHLSPAAIFATSLLLGRSLGPVEGSIGTWKAVTSVEAELQPPSKAHDREIPRQAGHAAAAAAGENFGSSRYP